jgi:coproporphyrinogen III oxidase-like Fe-S oxidoreductase
MSKVSKAIIAGVGKDGRISGKVDAQAYVGTIGYPEVGVFTEEKALQKFYKQLDMEQLVEWATLEGLTWKACPESAPIERMRVCMGIYNKHFPKQDTSSKKESVYKKYTLEQLAQMAVDNGVAVEVTDDNRILRMRLIMALTLGKLSM